MKFRIHLGCQVNYADIEHETYKVRMFSLLTKEMPTPAGPRTMAVPYYHQVVWWGKEAIPRIMVGTSPLCQANLPITLLNTHAVGACPHCKPLNSLDEVQKYVRQVYVRLMTALEGWDPKLLKDMPAEEDTVTVTLTATAAPEPVLLKEPAYVDYGLLPKSNIDKELFKTMDKYFAEAKETIEKTANEPGVKSDREKVPA